MKRDIVFWSSKRFDFEKTEENDFRLDGHQNKHINSIEFRTTSNAEHLAQLQYSYCFSV